MFQQPPFYAGACEQNVYAYLYIYIYMIIYIHSFCLSLGRATRQQKPQSTPRFGTLKAYLPTNTGCDTFVHWVLS